MKLPPPSGAAAPDARDALEQATAACRGVRTMSAEVGASGSVGGHGLRGRLLVGLAAPSSARIEAVAPFGQPIFIFVAAGREATLLLPRDNRVLERGDPEQVLAAVAGVPLGPADLRDALLGCVSVPESPAGQMAGDDWRVLTEQTGTTDGAKRIYLHRERPSAAWRLAAVTHRPGDPGEWRAEYRENESGLPRSVRLVSGDDGRRFDLRLTLSQLETNATLGPDVFRVEVPRNAEPITIRELQDAGPLRGAEAPSKGPSR
jgi:outer membrane lipoprotein-sorting protein